MKASEIEPGTVYWVDRANTWREYSSNGLAVVFPETTTRWHRSPYSRTVSENPTGRRLRGQVAEGHTGAGTVVFVLPGTVRAPLEHAQAEIAAAKAKRERAYQARDAARAQSREVGEALHTRLKALELPGHLSSPTVSPTRGVRLELTIEQANALTAILGASEERFQAGYAEGQRDAEAERRQQLGYISVEEERERDARLASMGVAQRCPAGPGCSGAAFPFHPAHPQLVSDDALPDADERALQRGLGVER